MQNEKMKVKKLYELVTDTILFQPLRKLRARLLKSYQSFDYIPVYNFYTTDETGDLRYLYKLKPYNKLPDVDTENLKPQWDEIRQVYINMKGDNAYMDLFWKMCEYHELMQTYNLLYFSLLSLSHRINKEHIEYLKTKNIKIDTETTKKYRESIEIAKKRIENYRSKMAILEYEIEEESKKDKNITFYRMIADIRVNAGIPIDIHKTLMPEFMEIMESINQKVKDAKARYNKKT